MQVFNHLDFEYFTEEIGRSAAKSAKINLFLKNSGSKSHFFPCSYQWFQIDHVDHNRKYLTEEIMSKRTKSANIIIFWAMKSQKTSFRRF